jgi:hypothetical protein
MNLVPRAGDRLRFDPPCRQDDRDWRDRDPYSSTNDRPRAWMSLGPVATTELRAIRRSSEVSSG